MFHRIAEADAARSLAMLLCSWYCSAEVGFYSCMLPSSSCFSCLLHICYYFVLVGSVWLRCLRRAQTVWFFCVSCMCARNKHNVWFFSCNMRIEYSLRFYWVAPYLLILVAGALTCILHQVLHVWLVTVVASDQSLSCYLGHPNTGHHAAFLSLAKVSLCARCRRLKAPRIIKDCFISNFSPVCNRHVI